MSGYTNDFSASHGHASVVAQIVEGAIKSIAGTELAAVVQMLQDKGLLRPEEEEWATCGNGHAYERSLPSCPRCGDDNGTLSISLDSPDAEIDRDEDRPASCGDTDDEVMPRAEAGLVEQIEALLVAAGLPNAGAVAETISVLWAAEVLPTVELLTAVLAEVLPAEREEARFLAECLLHKLRPLSKPTASPTADLSIFHDADWGTLRCEAINPLDGLVKTGKRDGSITVDGVHASANRVLRWLGPERLKTLEAVGAVLIDERGDFFNASNRREANLVLVSSPLTQKHVAERVGVSRSMLNRWCRPTDGIQVRTVHGVVPLGAFFSLDAQTDMDATRTRPAVIEALAAEFRAHPELENMGWVNVKVLLSEWNLEMSDRTWRGYKKEVHAILTADKVSPVGLPKPSHGAAAAGS
jgi:hypothetical protein